MVGEKPIEYEPTQNVTGDKGMQNFPIITYQ